MAHRPFIKKDLAANSVLLPNVPRRKGRTFDLARDMMRSGARSIGLPDMGTWDRGMGGGMMGGMMAGAGAFPQMPHVRTPRPPGIGGIGGLLPQQGPVDWRFTSANQGGDPYLSDAMGMGPGPDGAPAPMRPDGVLNPAALGGLQGPKQIGPNILELVRMMMRGKPMSGVSSPFRPQMGQGRAFQPY